MKSTRSTRHDGLGKPKLASGGRLGKYNNVKPVPRYSGYWRLAGADWEACGYPDGYVKPTTHWAQHFREGVVELKIKKIIDAKEKK